jgi:hypothetical protein
MVRIMRRAPLLAFLLLALLAPAAAAATRTIDLPKLFATQLERARAQTDVPILLPSTMRSDFRRHYPEGRATANAWRFDLGAVRRCHQATACFIAEFKGVRDGRPSGRRAIRLARGRTGYYRPLSCGASCSPPSIEWRERHALYSIQAKVAKRELVRMANSAIRNGPR